MAHPTPQISIDDNLKELMSAAAAKYNMPLAQYLDAISRQLREREQPNSESEQEGPQPQSILDAIRKHRDAIAASRKGESIDVLAIIDQMHEERDQEIMGLY